MKLIFVAGLADIDKRTIIDLALQRAGCRDKFRIVDFERLGNIAGEIQETRDLDAARQALSNFYSEVEKVMITGLKDQKDNVIVNGCFTVDSLYGYVMALPEEFFSSFKPDGIILIERVAEGDHETDEQQHINRHYGTLYSSMHGSFLKIIKLRENRMMDTVKELSEVIKH